MKGTNERREREERGGKGNGVNRKARKVLEYKSEMGKYRWNGHGGMRAAREYQKLEKIRNRL